MRTWLIQRLQKPHTTGILAGMDNPFSFGGGLKNGGLTDQASDLIRGIWSFDYMGAAEFEFGAVPKALHAIAKAVPIAFTLSDVKLGPKPKWMRTKGEKAKNLGIVYVLAPANLKEHAEKVVRDQASEPHPQHAQLKEPSLLWHALVEEAHSRTFGWLELDNGFMFFTDKEMFEKACELFGVAVPS